MHHPHTKVGTFGVRIKEKRIECNHSLERKGKGIGKGNIRVVQTFLNDKATMSNQPTMLGTQPTVTKKFWFPMARFCCCTQE
jgi:hypothetical protein